MIKKSELQKEINKNKNEINEIRKMLNFIISKI